MVGVTCAITHSMCHSTPHAYFTLLKTVLVYLCRRSFPLTLRSIKRKACVIDGLNAWQIFSHAYPRPVNSLLH